MSGVRFIEVTSEDAGQRVDNFLMRHYRSVPKTLIYRVIRKGEVRVNKGRVKQNSRLNDGDIVRVPPIRVAEKVASEVPASQLKRIEDAILYEDADLMVINKPSGVAVHGGSGIQWGLIEVVRALRPLAKRLELVHRLDRDTSGCILLAKKASVLKQLHADIRENKMTKIYLALVEGHWPSGVEKVDLPLLKNTLQSGERMVKVDEQGKPSVSYFKVQQRFEQYDLVSVRLKTGRTHQIRVHALSQGCPVVGDDKYGDKVANKAARKIGMKRLALHAHLLGFEHPVTQAWLEIEAPLHNDFKVVLERLSE
ncbi:23S rRNA pseudouridine(955/2504/2580) synthase RluC [Hydrogenovibrio sp. SC-1]|uniref:23S rRNA pseudouridine(955/2504/2580) synthase RluC n=1 Tax=Hydrogenovibrio sp. SC-1 TaxID=2065820 RepID=UPI000C7DC815|nr:23S rRNA pseudouridine(955/2504/2580) synthase RluC [Hydrogenovibrio sp. SC-1]PLA75601.1 23S rRNA pseudouridine(955/2504/2580) synthase RluC [Hydrogenovibrio sp. SC-1]